MICDATLIVQHKEGGFKSNLAKAIAIARVPKGQKEL
jgi:hypothetical protein